MPSCRQRYRRMRHTLIKFRSLVHIYVNRRRYLKVRWAMGAPPDPGALQFHPHHLLGGVDREHQSKSTLVWSRASGSPWCWGLCVASLCLQRKEDARRRAEEEKERMKQVME